MKSELNLMKKVLRGEKTSRPPVWFMRQAGRVLPSYMKLREQYNFQILMQNPELAAKVTLLPFYDLGVDALILFSDILVIPQALGMNLVWTEKGPTFPNNLANNPSFELTEDLEKLSHVYQAIEKINLEKPEDLTLIGFCGAPFTVFCYMVQGFSSNHSFSDAIKLFYQEPLLSMKILEKITKISITYAENQIARKIDAFQLFETHAGLLPAKIYLEKIMPLNEKILTAVKNKNCATIFFPKGLNLAMQNFPEDLCDFISIDWQMDLKSAREIIPQKIGLQGNFDPRVLLTDVKTIEKELLKFHEFGKNNLNWIFNLGHGVLPKIPVENVKFAIDWIKSHDWQR